MQTEDSGTEKSHIFTHCYMGGVIIASAKIEYKDLVEQAGHEKAVKRRMQAQHKLLMKSLRHGDYNDKIVLLLGSLEGELEEKAEGEKKAAKKAVGKKAVGKKAVGKKAVGKKKAEAEGEKKAEAEAEGKKAEGKKAEGKKAEGKKKAEAERPEESLPPDMDEQLVTKVSRV
ncbi:MAG: hypothetical protein JRH20_22025, partial [Deltaproteobacteria bacterium]|nr:hypothetical protein [Deltaproteobacteria bacterium]